MTDWLVDLLVDVLVGLLVDLLVGWSVNPLIGWLAGSFFGWFSMKWQAQEEKSLTSGSFSFFVKSHVVYCLLVRLLPS